MKRIVLMLTVLCIGLVSCSAPGEHYGFDIDSYLTGGTYKGISYEPTPVASVDDGAVESYILAVLEDNSSSEDITEGVYAEGDSLTIDFEGVYEGTAVRAANGYNTAIGAAGFFSEFEGGLTGLIGQNIAKEHKLSLTFKADIADAEWAGRTIDFTVKVHSVTRYHNAVLDDEFVKTVSSCQTVDEYKAYVKELLEKQALEDAHDADLDYLWASYVSSCTVTKYPQAEYESYVKYFNSLYEKQALALGMSTEDFMMLYYGITSEDVSNDAKNLVKQDMAMYLLSQKEGIAVSEAEYTSLGEALAIEKGFESLAKMEAENSKEYIQRSLLQTKVKEFILANATVSKAPAPSSTVN
ncbi:MAG: hypothetical protein E7646_00155 [Ruminococcaceae bacterium]|nr:hypothetical protein [Oscillospiraceae bacterium]